MVTEETPPWKNTPTITPTVRGKKMARMGPPITGARSVTHTATLPATTWTWNSALTAALIGKAASGGAVYMVAYCKNLDGGWGYLHRAMPAAAVADGTGDKTFTHHRGFILAPGIAANATAHQDCDPAPVVASAADSGTGSLRQALAAACPGATVTFSNTLAGETITLASELSITKTLTVDGGSHAVTVSGNQLARLRRRCARRGDVDHLSSSSARLAAAAAPSTTRRADRARLVLSDNVARKTAAASSTLPGY